MLAQFVLYTGLKSIAWQKYLDVYIIYRICGGIHTIVSCCKPFNTIVYTESKLYSILNNVFRHIKITNL